MTRTPRSKSQTRRVAAQKAPGAAKAAPAVSVLPAAEKRAPAAVATVSPAPEPIPESIPDWELAFFALYAEDAYVMARMMDRDPVPDPRLSPRWTVLGTLTAVDAPFRIGRHKIGARKSFYGWLLKSRDDGQLVLAIRGTQSMAEWAIDGLFAPRRAHPVAGRVHDGFWDLYASMRIYGKPLASVIGGEPITVVGHSLGAALATLASLELAKAAERDKAAGKPAALVRGVFVASPRVGDAAFVTAFGAAVPDHVMYRNSADLVPMVPAWLGYRDVPNVVTLSAAKAGIRISGGPAGQHHVLSYGALMDRTSLRQFTALPIDRQFLDCIHLGRVSL